MTWQRSHCANCSCSPQSIAFVGWSKIPRVQRVEFVVTEKVNGTNAAIQFQPYDPEADYPEVSYGIDFTKENFRFVFAAQSRTRIITPNDDNFGFAAWAYENCDSLFADLSYGVHHGEWYGQGIQRKYGLTEKRFALFNTTKFGGASFQTPRLDVVPVLYQGPDFSAGEHCYGVLRRDGSWIVPGFQNPEGIVIRELMTGASWKYTDAPAPKGPKDGHGNAYHQ